MNVTETEMHSCPVCGGPVIDDAWEDLEMHEDGGVIINAYPAYVCENDCGYVKEIHPAPNLFHFAKSELSQDAFFCWLFEHVRLSTDDVAQRIAANLLDEIILAYRTFYPEISREKMESYYLVDVAHQVDQIDILLTLESISYDEKVYIVIEDKVNSGESRKNQPEYYAEQLKKKDPEAVIIPVLLKTGYVTKEEKSDYDKRKIVFIGYEHIYHLFTSHSNELHEQAILLTWWQNFYREYYRPIQQVKTLKVNPEYTLKHFNRLCQAQNYPTNLAFKVITDYLFEDVMDLESMQHSVQGKRHADWHFQIQKKLWRNKNKKIRLNINLTWDLQRFSFVIKTVPIPYKSKRRLSEAEKKQYTALQKFIKTEIKQLNLDGWRVTNYYLTIARMLDIEDIALHTLKKKIVEDVTRLATKFDEIMEESTE